MGGTPVSLSSSFTDGARLLAVPRTMISSMTIARASIVKPNSLLYLYVNFIDWFTCHYTEGAGLLNGGSWEAK